MNSDFITHSMVLELREMCWMLAERLAYMREEWDAYAVRMLECRIADVEADVHPERPATCGVLAYIPEPAPYRPDEENET